MKRKENGCNSANEGVPDPDTMKLCIWSGGWGLPSVDPLSLQALATVRFAGVPVKIVECNNPWYGSIPRFYRMDQKPVTSIPEISSYIKSKNYNSDYGLSCRQNAEMVAYAEYLREALQTALEYYYWLDEPNFNEVIRPFYGSRLPWLYKMWYPESLKKRAKSLITSIYPDAEDQPESCELFIQEKAKKCLQLLSEKLDTNEFLMGTSLPSTIDAIAFSYLSPFWKIPLPHNPISEFIKGSSNLERYLARILSRYFPAAKVHGSPTASSRCTTYDSYGSVVDQTGTNDSNNYSFGQKMTAILFATLAMVTYGYRINVVRFPRQPSVMDHVIHHEEDEDYYEE